MPRVNIGKFVAGFSMAGAVMLVLNLLPYWRTYGRARFDGIEIAGFPFTFRHVGGFVNYDEFRVPAFVADVALALAVAFLAGWLAGRLRRPPPL